VTHGPRGPSAAEAGLEARHVDDYMRDWLGRRALPDNLRQAIAYSLLAPGKRIRPLLVLRCCAAVGGDERGALAPAAAVEMVHAFSLVHDDLPALDDDDLRRGRPTLHRHTSEAMAVLAGDALLGLAIELLAELAQPVDLSQRLCRELIRACNDMIAGQVQDTLPDFDPALPPLERLRTVHAGKTGALLRAACRMGALCGGADAPRLAAVTRYGEAIGLMFQVVDDLLDVTASSEELGKTAGKDAGQHKLTYAALLGVEGSRAEVRRLRDEALEALGALEGQGGRTEPLARLCRELAARTR
jgi:geranylgeranyl pyrophosphate synthase